MTIAAEMGLMESSKQATIAGGGVTFVSLCAAVAELQSGSLVLVPVKGFEIRRDFYIVRSRTRVLSRAAEALLAYLDEQYDTAPPGNDGFPPAGAEGKLPATPARRQARDAAPLNP
jgi:DNA-binding transcriptional LysR family regulator